MKVSSKGRYGLAAMICIAKTCKENECITIIKISEILGISKIYLEQVFSLLKKSNLVTSIKGAQGGYQLAKSKTDINAYDILNAIEVGLFEKTENSLSKDAHYIDKAMELLVWNELDLSTVNLLKSVTLEILVVEATKQNLEDEFMFYI